MRTRGVHCHFFERQISLYYCGSLGTSRSWLSADWAAQASGGFFLCMAENNTLHVTLLLEANRECRSLNYFRDAAVFDAELDRSRCRIVESSSI
jgi:hypothetical protein